MRRAEIYLRGGAILVQASSCTTAGVWIHSGPCTRLPADSPDVELGGSVLGALQRSESEVPHPTEWKSAAAPVLRAAGVRSWRAFAAGALHVGVAEESGRLELAPTVNRGREGFEEIPALRSTLPLPATPEEAGAAIRRALAVAALETPFG